MFVIKPATPKDALHALFLLSYYEVSFTAYSDGEHSNTTFIKVSREYRKDDLRLAEMAFQMSFRQKGKICPVCEMVDKGKQTCGHLTFTEVI
jgi:hypothetical protein